MRVGKKIVVIPDVHEAANLDQVEAAIAREAPDLTIFLGDYFDRWGDGPRDAGRTAEWLAHSLGQPRRVHLYGNHDLPYAFPRHPAIRCSGWTLAKARAIDAHLWESGWAPLVLAHWEGDLLFTHAGWSRLTFPAGRATPRNPKSYLTRQVKEARGAILDGRTHWTFQAGEIRGGTAHCGGLTWCDLEEFRAMPGVNQIFGHTADSLGPIPNRDGVENWICDTTNADDGIRHYLVVAQNAVTAWRLDGSPALVPAMTP